MRAIILAAGSGTRLSPLTNGRPKCLVPVGERLLIDYQLAALAAVGVEDIILVVGYEAEQVRRHCGPHRRYIDNPDYQTTNSIYSLFLAADALATDTFLFNCDILFHADILKRMLSAGPNVVAVDSHTERTADEMNVRIGETARVEAISKNLDHRRAQAQSIQLVKFDAAGAGSVAREVQRLIREDHKDAFPTLAYGPLIEAGSLGTAEGGDLPWTEIDDLDDYRRAVEEVLPRLQTYGHR